MLKTKSNLERLDKLYFKEKNQMNIIY